VLQRQAPSSSLALTSGLERLARKKNHRQRRFEDEMGGMEMMRAYSDESIRMHGNQEIEMMQIEQIENVHIHVKSPTA